jgi:hypothetical protein
VQNDVDPTTMTLGEIYQQPEDYFEPVYSNTDDPGYMDRFGMYRTMYNGVRIKQHGFTFFNIKEDDDKTKMNPDTGLHLYCSMCDSANIHPDKLKQYWKAWNMLGEEAAKWRHP